MPKVIIVQVIYNNKNWIEPVFEAIFKQTFKDFRVVVVIAGNEDRGKEFLVEKFPQVEIIDPGFNIGFAGGHNLIFSAIGGSAFGGENPEFYQLVNPDMIMKPNYIEEMLKVFNDEKVGAATGKLYRIQNTEYRIQNTEEKILDTTGVIISKSGRARDRGQHEADKGQYDLLTEVDAVSGAGCMYRTTALQAVKCQISKSKYQKTLPQTNYEFFDEDFHSYWEDVDLSWRMKNCGWKNIFVPSAVGFHGRVAGSSKNGYFDLFGFIKHHKALPERIRQLNYQNHIFMYIKNSKYFYPQFFVREFFMFLYTLFFEISTFKILPKMLKLIPKMWKKRKLIINGNNI
jgi:GT2 family glycosyltransferase